MAQSESTTTRLWHIRNGIRCRHAKTDVVRVRDKSIVFLPGEMYFHTEPSSTVPSSHCQ